VSAAPANAQSSVDFRVGDYGRRGGVSVDIHIGNGRWYPRGGHYPRGPVYDRGCYPDYRGDCGRGPVYRGDRDCRHFDGCGHRDYRPSSIQVLVIDYVPAYDRYGRYMGERRVERWVNAYWDHQRGGYWYTDRYGRYVPGNDQ
jgi:hypothetical protein